MVATATPLAPKSRVKSAVASEAARMLTTLLPSRIAPISLSPSSFSFSAISAPVLPLSACARSLPREAAVSAVSDPEKKADIRRSTTIAPAVSQVVVSSMRSAVIRGASFRSLRYRRAARRLQAAAPRSVAGEGMMFEHERAQPLVEDMGVDLGGGDIGVAEQRLDDAKIGAAGEEMGGEGVAQDVGVHPC